MKKILKWILIIPFIMFTFFILGYFIFVENRPQRTSQLIKTPTNTISFVKKQHLHSSSIAQLPNGNMIATWFQGSGEKTANDVVIMASIYDGKWNKPYVIADTPNLPDINPVIFVNNNDVFLFYYTTVFNTWQSSVMKYKKGLFKNGIIKWGKPKKLPINLENKSFKKSFNERLKQQLKKSEKNFITSLYNNELIIYLSDKKQFRMNVNNPLEKLLVKLIYKLIWSEYTLYATTLLDGTYKQNKREYFPKVMDELNRSYGWQSRSKPIINKGRILLPLYADVYQMSIITYSDDNGNSWDFSNPILAGANIQPSLVVNRDGDILAYMRDNGLYPKRVLVSKSTDNGLTWTSPIDLKLENSVSPVDVVSLKNGNMIMVRNDTDDFRQSIVINKSTDGINWGNPKYIELDANGNFAYPAIIVDNAGKVHITYSSENNKNGSIKHYILK